MLLFLHHAAAVALEDQHAIIKSSANHPQPDFNDNDGSRTFQNIVPELTVGTTSNDSRGRHLQPDSDITDQSTAAAAAAAAHINIFDAGSHKKGNSTSIISSSSGGKSKPTSTIRISGAKSKKQQPKNGNTAAPTPSNTKMPVGGKSKKIPKNGNTASPTSSHTKMPVGGKASKGKAKSGKGSKAGGKSGKAGLRIPGPVSSNCYYHYFAWIDSTPSSPFCKSFHNATPCSLLLYKK
jgi:hypothetical protein